MIEIKNLTKRYGNKKAVDDISFTVEKGEILGFLGPNGAGKTTTMNILTGYISSNEGSVKVEGFDILENPNEVKKRIGYLPENPPLYLEMTVSEYLDFVFELKNIKLDKKAHINEIMEIVKITDVKNRKINNLSKGYKQRVGLAQALIGNPEVLILDEPTVGLDPKQIIEIRNVIKELGVNRTIILSSHILPEVSAICERVIIINKGKIVASDKPENLSKALSHSFKYIVRVEGDENAIIEAIKLLENVKSVESLGSKEENSIDVMVEAYENCDIRKELSHKLVSQGFTILMMKSMDLSLEDIFLQLTTEENNQILEQNEETENEIREIEDNQNSDEKRQQNNQDEEENKNDGDI